MVERTVEEYEVETARILGHDGSTADPLHAAFSDLSPLRRVDKSLKRVAQVHTLLCKHTPHHSQAPRALALAFELMPCPRPRALPLRAPLTPSDLTTLPYLLPQTCLAPYPLGHVALSSPPTRHLS